MKVEKKEVLEIISARGIKTIRVDWCDHYGINRGKGVPADRFSHVIDDGIHCALPTFALDLGGNVATGTGTAEEVGYADLTAIPDLSTFRVIPWEENTARVIADLYFEGKPLALSPRGILKKVVKEYNDKGLKPVVGSELEFYLFQKNNGKWEYYADKTSMVYTMNPMVDKLNIIGKVKTAMAQMGYSVLYFNHEFFPSQYEINIIHGDVVEVADITFTFKQVVKEIAFQHGLLATFMGKPRNDGGGSGYHLHISLYDESKEKNLFDDPKGKYGLSELALQSIAGQLKHAEGMSAILASNINSYKRYVPGAFAAYYIVWGLDNRTTYIRIPPERGHGTRIENRAPDGSGNPYLVFAAALAAGLDGINRKLDPGEPFIGDAYRLLEGTNQYPVVPLSFGEALEEFKKSDFIREALGEPFVKMFLAVKGMEWNRFRNYVTDWEFNEYAFYL
jgi:glutamine synthetase